MLVPPADCQKKGCIHYQGWKSFAGIIKNVCKEFPKGIPYKIAFEDKICNQARYSTILVQVRYEDRGMIGDGQTSVSEQCLDCKHLDRKWHSICKAFPDGIPSKIAFEGQQHFEVVTGQVGDYVFTKIN